MLSSALSTIVTNRHNKRVATFASRTPFADTESAALCCSLTTVEDLFLEINLASAILAICRLTKILVRNSHDGDFFIGITTAGAHQRLITGLIGIYLRGCTCLVIWLVFTFFSSDIGLEGLKFFITRARVSFVA